MTPLDFLRLLWQHKPEGFYILIWMLQGKQSYWFRSISQAAEFLQANRTDVYVGVGAAQHDYGPDRRCPSVEIAGIPGLWADFDIKSEAHPKALPDSIGEALTLIPASLPPTIIIATGNGLQAWWLFKTPWIFASEGDLKSVSTLSSRFQTLLRHNASQRGWSFERLSDLARVLRIPGTINAKDPNNPKDVRVYSSIDRHYDPSEFQDYLDVLAIPDAEAKQLAAKEWAERCADKPLVINLNARIPQEMLDHWVEADTRFKNTWFRQRHDLNDQSQSGYDMALACFALGAGLSQQQSIDLIVHHRSRHRQKQRTRLDYFQKTLTKAANMTGGQRASAESTVGCRDQNQPPLPESDPVNSDNLAADAATVKAQLWDRLSEILGIRVYRMVKITGNEPLYLMELEGGRVEFRNVGKLVAQESFRKTIAAAVNKYIAKHKTKIWEQIVQMMLDALTEEDGGEEMDIEGAGRIHLVNYLSEGRFIASVEGQSSQGARWPLIHEGKVTVCASDLQIYVNKTTGQNISIGGITGMLSALGAKSFRLRGNFREQSRWALPRKDFDPARYSPRHMEDPAHGGE